MKTQKTRLEEVEQAEGKKELYVVKQVLECKSFEDEDLYRYKDEEKLMTLQEAKERFKDGDLLYIRYTNDWRSQASKELSDL